MLKRNQREAASAQLIRAEKASGLDLERVRSVELDRLLEKHSIPLQECRELRCRVLMGLEAMKVVKRGAEDIKAEEQENDNPKASGGRD